MKTAEDWFPILNGLPNTDESGKHAKPEFVKVIKRIQSDCLREAAEIAKAQKVPSGTKDWNAGYYLAVKHASDAILAKVKEIQP